jgi:hypothetical protein
MAVLRARAFIIVVPETNTKRLRLFIGVLQLHSMAHTRRTFLILQGGLVTTREINSPVKYFLLTYWETGVD